MTDGMLGRNGRTGAGQTPGADSVDWVFSASRIPQEGCHATPVRSGRPNYLAIIW